MVTYYIEFLDETPDEVHEDVVQAGLSHTRQFLWLVHQDGSEAYVNLASIRTAIVTGRLSFGTSELAERRGPCA